MRIKTNISKSDVKYIDDFPSNEADRKVYKYCCPICLRYFNTVLVSSCCKNYICRLCIGDMAKRAKKDTAFVIRCSYCQVDDYRLEDVKEEDTIKHYTDSPFKMTKTPGVKQHSTFKIQMNGTKDEEVIAEEDSSPK